MITNPASASHYLTYLLLYFTTGKSICWSLSVTVSFLSLIPFFSIANPTDYVIYQYTDEHGLPQNSIKGIATDNLGFTWLITEKGVVRYDGHGQFKLTDSLSAQLVAERMVSLHADGLPGALWARTTSGQSIYLHNGKALVASKADENSLSLPSHGHPSIHFATGLPNRYRIPLPECFILGDVNGARFIIGEDTIQYENRHRIVAAYPLPHSMHNPWFFVIMNQNLYYIPELNNVVCMTPKGTSHQVHITGELLAEPPSSNFQIYWNNATYELFIYCNKNFYTLRADRDGNLNSTRILSEFSFEENRITIAHYDALNQQLLLGSDSKGLFVIKRKRFHTVYAKENSPNEIYYLQTLLKDGSILADKGKRFDQHKKYHAVPALAKTNTQYARLHGPDGNLLVLTEDSLFTLTPMGERRIRQRATPKPCKVLYQSDGQHTWLGSVDGSLLTWDQQTDSFSAVVNLGHQITWIEQSGKEHFWIGTYQGLYRFHIPSKKVTSIPALAQRHIRCLYPDQEHRSRLWISTEQQGLFLYEDTTLTALPLDKAGYLGAAHCMLEDSLGYFWISTNKGLFQVNKQQLLDYRANPNHTPYYFHYDKRDGFATNEFNGGCQPCAVKLSNGYFSFPSLDGLVWFNPLKIHPELPQGPVLIDAINLDGLEIPARDSLSLPQRFSRLNLSVSTPYYGQKKNLYIEYSIAGTTEDELNWLPLNPTDHTISINKLSSGWHTVTVRMRNGLSLKDYVYGAMSLYVNPYFYETTWFIILVVFGLGMLGWAITWLRTRFIVKQNIILSHRVALHTEKLKQQHELQQRLSASIVHDVKAPLNYVVMALQGIHQRANGMLSHEIKLVYDATKQIFRYSSNLSKLAKIMLTKNRLRFCVISLYDVGQKQVDIFEPIAASVGTCIHNEIPTGMVIHSHEGVLSIIIHNLLDNATKFTKKGEIHLYAGETTHHIRFIKIADTGIGMRASELEFYNSPTKNVTDDPHLENGGLGLVLVKDMVKLIHGELVIRSAIGQGTIITITFPDHYTS
ncbi:sensor histidine kinase [Parapedobacter tibetensis]|uniref:sensor histidine kinase n=1 Tax=Parapedobacter tibetensis TaxID=2972951 RepID=UPI00214DE979|nr:ATP-binding protein [Parapedobacter tibetensis]